MVHGTDRPYLLSVLAAAKRYGINHLEIAGNNPTFSEQFVQYPQQTALIEEIAGAGKKQGVDIYVWIREFNVRTKEFATDLSTVEGAAFWKARQEALRQALRRLPSIRGVVMSYASTPTEIWDVQGDRFWQDMSQPERIRFTTERFREVAVTEFGKRMLVRDFNHSPDELRWLVEGLRDETGITMHSKAEPQDWQFFYPHSPAQGAYGKTPQVVEFDLAGEYWGQSLIPVSLVDYLKYRWTYDRAKGARGVVGRIDRDDNRTLGSPSEINLYAHSVLMKEPETSASTIYDGWNSTRYGLKPGSAASRTLTKIYLRCTEAAKLQYYTLGFWTPKSQTSIPDRMASIEGTLRDKSTALWDRDAKGMETRLLNPTPDTVRQILVDKRRAVELTETNLSNMAKLKSTMRPTDYAPFLAQLRFMRDQALVWEAMARAYWTTKLAQGDEASRVEAIRAIDAFDARVATLQNPSAPRFAATQREAGRKLAVDMRGRLETASGAQRPAPPGG